MNCCEKFLLEHFSRPLNWQTLLIFNYVLYSGNILFYFSFYISLKASAEAKAWAN